MSLLFQNDKALAWAKKRSKKLQPNNWISALFKEDFLLKKEPKILIQESSPAIGLGVFAAEYLPPLTYIGEYGGLVRRSNRKLDGSNYYLFRYLEYPFWIPYVIDGEKEGNFTRFLNHSQNPNLLFSRMIVDDICHIIFFTKRACKKGEELTFNYGADYWKKRSEPILGISLY
jgi:SET domain-containing protein